MSTMVCSRCNQTGIYWRGLGGLCPYTFCPHCDSEESPQPEEKDNEEEEEEIDVEVIE